LCSNGGSAVRCLGSLDVAEGDVAVKTALVLGGGGFIGSHMVRRLKAESYWVRAVDLKRPQFSESAADEFVEGRPA
jgi:hypothetical protein